MMIRKIEYRTKKSAPVRQHRSGKCDNRMALPLIIKMTGIARPSALLFSVYQIAGFPSRFLGEFAPIFTVEEGVLHA